MAKDNVMDNNTKQQTNKLKGQNNLHAMTI